MNWLKNPYIIGLLVFIAFLVVVIVGSTIAALVLSGKYKRRKTTPITTPTKSSGWFWRLVIVGVVGIGIIGVARYFKTPKEIVTQTTVTPKTTLEKRWVYTFVKTEGAQGLSPSLRNNLDNPYPAIIIAYDKHRFDFEVHLPQSQRTVPCNWLKSQEKYGTYFQPLGDGKIDRGTWELQPEQLSGSQPNSFVGWMKNTNNQVAIIWLRAVD